MPAMPDFLKTVNKTERYLKMKKRILTAALALVMCLSLIPVSAMAATPEIASASGDHSASLIKTPYYIGPYISDAGLISISEGFIDNEANLIIPKNYDSTRSFSDGLAAVEKDGKWGYMDTSGNMVIPHKFDEAAMFYNGVAVITGGSYPEWSYSVIDKTGTVIILEGTYDRIVSADGTGLIPVGKDDGDGNYLWGFTDLSGKLVIPLQYQNIYYYTANSSGLVAVCKGEKWGFIDKSGAERIPFEYDGVVGFNEFGYAMVYKTGGWGIIDSTNKIVMPLKYSPIPGTGYPFSFLNENLVIVYEFDGNTGDEISYVIDLRTGAKVTDFDRFTSIYPFADGYTLAYLGGEQCIIDDSGTIIISAETLKENNLRIAGEYGAGGAQQSGNFGDGHFVALFSDSASNSYSHYIIKITKNSTADVPSDWAEVEVNAAVAAGLVPEHLQKNYTLTVSRGNVAQMFINLIEKSSGQTIEAFMASKGVSMNENAFTDTKDTAVLAANALGIINGMGDNKFEPDGTFTRAQVAVIINRVARVLGVSTDGYSHGFTDVSGHWADSELGWPVHAGIVNGMGDNKYNPEGMLTTEQAIMITYRALQVDMTSAS